MLSHSPFRPGQLVEVLVVGEYQYKNGLTEKLALLFKETQAQPQVQVLTEADVAAEIAAYRGGDVE